MSLLLEALKKAELAKQTAKSEAPPPEPRAEPRAEPTAPVMTREKLPDILQPLEILTDDLPSSEKSPPPEPPRPTLSPQETDADRPGSQTMSAPGESLRADHRAQARQLFEVKEMDYNPRRPFYLTLGALALVGAGYGGYVWWQLQPKSSLSSQALSAAAARPVAAPPQAAATPAPAASLQPGAAPTDTTQAPQTAVPPPPQAGATIPRIPPIQPVRPARPTVQPASRETATPGPTAPPARAGGELAPIAITPPTLLIDPLLEQAYQAFQRNDLGVARDGYQRVLAREPTNRDALLGLAAIDVRTGNLEIAEARYLKLLEMDPRDSYAVAGLLALRGQLDPVASESRLKTLIANQPEAAHLHFSLGTQYARQSRWAEAQAAFFKAYSADPENADYAFNLAVSLDQLRQRKPAFEYYQRALVLAEKRPASFNRGQAQTRVQELSR